MSIIQVERLCVQQHKLQSNLPNFNWQNNPLPCFLQLGITFPHWGISMLFKVCTMAGGIAGLWSTTLPVALLLMSNKKAVHLHIPTYCETVHTHIHTQARKNKLPNKLNKMTQCKSTTASQQKYYRRLLIKYALVCLNLAQPMLGPGVSDQQLLSLRMLNLVHSCLFVLTQFTNSTLTAEQLQVLTGSNCHSKQPCFQFHNK